MKKVNEMQEINWNICFQSRLAEMNRSPLVTAFRNINGVKTARIQGTKVK